MAARAARPALLAVFKTVDHDGRDQPVHDLPPMRRRTHLTTQRDIDPAVAPPIRFPRSAAPTEQVGPCRSRQRTSRSRSSTGECCEAAESPVASRSTSGVGANAAIPGPLSTESSSTPSPMPRNNTYPPGAACPEQVGAQLGCNQFGLTGSVIRAGGPPIHTIRRSAPTSSNSLMAWRRCSVRSVPPFNDHHHSSCRCRVDGHLVDQSTGAGKSQSHASGGIEPIGERRIHIRDAGSVVDERRFDPRRSLTPICSTCT